MTTGTLAWSTATTPPSNDNFANAITISGASGSTTGSNVGATYEAGEPKPPFNPTDNQTSVWWKWVATSSGNLSVDLNGSDFDTMMAIYTGSSLSNLQLVGANDDWYIDGAWQNSGRSKVICRVVSGTTYYIQVAGYSEDWGNIALAWSVVAASVTNDYYDSATTISGSSGTVTGNLLNAGTELGEPWLFPPGTPAVETNSGNQWGDTWAAAGTYAANYDWGGHSVWYSWTCPSTGVYEFDTTGSTEYTLLGVFPSAASISQLDLFAGRANAYGSDSTNYKSRVTILCTSGHIYKITVQGDYGGAGHFTLNWASVSVTAPANDNLANAIELGDSGTVNGSTAHSTYETGELKPLFEYGSGRSVWYKVHFSGVGGFLNADGSDSWGDWMNITVWSGPANATYADLIYSDSDDGNTPSVGGIITGEWAYIQIDGYDGLAGDFTLNWSTTKAAKTLDYTGPSVSHQTIFMGLLGVQGERNLDVTITYSHSTDYKALQIYAYSSPSVYQLPVPAIGGSSIPFHTESALYQISGSYQLQVAMARFDSTSTSRTRTLRYALPAGLTGVLEFYISGGTDSITVDSWHASFYEAPGVPLNDTPDSAKLISGKGKYTLVPDVWAGATSEGGRKIPVMWTNPSYYPRNNYISGDVSWGRSVWFRWTPQADDEVLYFWWNQNAICDDSADAAQDIQLTVTVYDRVGDSWSYFISYPNLEYNINNIHGDWPSYFWEGDTLNGDFGTVYDYTAIPGRYDVADYRSGSPLYICVDVMRTAGWSGGWASRLPTIPVEVGWFTRKDGTEAYGPEDLGILSADQFAGNANQLWYRPGLTSKGDVGYLDPSWTAGAGFSGVQLDNLEHPFTESKYLPVFRPELPYLNTDGETNKNVNWATFDIVDGTVYSTWFGAVKGSGSNDYSGVAVFNHGLLNPGDYTKFDRGIDQSPIGPNDPANFNYRNMDFIALVHDEVWTTSNSLGQTNYRFNKSGGYLGEFDPPADIVFNPLTPARWNDRNHRYFFVARQTGVYPNATYTHLVWDAVANTYTPTGLPNADWIPTKEGFIRYRHGANLVPSNHGFVGNCFFAAHGAFGTPTIDAIGDGWSPGSVAITGGAARLVKSWFSDGYIYASWSGAFPSGGALVFRYLNSSNYLKATADGVYKVVNGVTTLIASYGGGFVFGSNSQMRVELFNQYIIVSDGTTTHFDYPDNTHHVGNPRATYYGVTHGVMASSTGALSGFDGNITMNSTLDYAVLMDVYDLHYQPRLLGWDVTADIIRDTGYSPFFDTFDQPYRILAVGKDGYTVYVTRWWESYHEYARDNSAWLLGNVIATSVYAFDLKTLTYKGKVGQYDIFPNWGVHGWWFDNIYPYQTLGGPLYLGLRDKAILNGMTAANRQPASKITAEISGTNSADERSSMPLDTASARFTQTTHNSTTGTVGNWTKR